MNRFSGVLLSGVVVYAALLLLVLVVLAAHRPEHAPVEESLLLGSPVATGRQFDPDLGSLKGLVPEVGGYVPEQAGTVVEHGTGFRDLDWLRAQGSAFTLQVLGARNEEAVKSFIAGQVDPDAFSYFESREAGEPWFVVVYGNYSSRELALGVADSLDFGLGSRPFPKRFSAYADAISLAASPPEQPVAPADADAPPAAAAPAAPASAP